MRTETAPDTRFRSPDYFALPEGFPCELVEGHFVKQPAPTYGHQHVVLALLFHLCQRLGVDRVVPSPIDLQIDDYNVLQPDVAVYREPLPRSTRRLPVPAVVVEVLSPSTARHDRERKTGIYLAAGVAEVWLVDPDTGAVEVHTHAGATAYAPDEPATSRAVPGLTVTGRDAVA